MAAGMVTFLPAPSSLAPGLLVSGDGALQCFLSSALCVVPRQVQTLPLSGGLRADALMLRCADALMLRQGMLQLSLFT